MSFAQYLFYMHNNIRRRKKLPIDSWMAVVSRSQRQNKKKPSETPANADSIESMVTQMTIPLSIAKKT